ncbi:MFS transporter [Martelella alba]|uniref:MFS transporter n=1 Tax=Martelella alba TaxID=2590451 RepID=A0ABY2SL12_9HYPH|nr:MFS transporter [Martelella alba]TKI06067.1 MFS transporter [Martelella alba]
MRLSTYLFGKEHISINLCFLFNAMGTNLLMPLALLYLAGTSLSTQEFIYLGTVKFWAHAVFYFFVVPWICRFNIKKTIGFALFIKFISLAIFFYGSNFTVCLVVMLVNGLAASIFSTASKFYIRATSENISESFSVRMTLNNTGAAISPLIISALVFFNMTFTTALIALLFFFMVGALAAVGLKRCERTQEPPAMARQLTGVLSRESALVATLSIAFAMLYYTFETIVPLELVKLELKGLVGPVMLLNTVVIILCQIPLYRFITLKVGVINAMMLFTAICIGFFLPYHFHWVDWPGLLLIVLGVTFLEIFYGAGIETVIASAESEPKVALLDGISSLAIAIGSAMAAMVYGRFLMFLPLVITLLALSFYFTRSRIPKACV